MRYLLIVVGFLVLIVVAVIVVGWTLPTHHRVQAARAYRTTPGVLFALISDVRAFPAWRTDVKNVEVLSDATGRLRWRETTKDGPPITYVAEESRPPERLVSRIADTNLPFGGSWTYELTSGTADQTVLTITEDGDVYNPIFRFASRFVMGQTATIDRYLADIERKFPAVAHAGANAPSSESSSR